MEPTAYFSVAYRVPVNLELLPDGSELPDPTTFEAEIPDTFRLASEVASMDPAGLRSLRLVGDVARDLADYLNLLSRKINAVMGHVLMQYDDPANRYHTKTLGADGFTTETPLAAATGSLVRIKLFVLEEHIAIYAIGQIAASDDSGSDIRFVRLRDQDRELLIRASLHQQTRLLKERAERKEHS